MARILTLQDILMYYESSSLLPTVSTDTSLLNKAMVNTGLGQGVYNPIFGAQAWYNLNAESNWFGVMPKMTWDKSGIRIITSFTRSASDIAISETGTIPEATVPSIQTIVMHPKVAVNSFMTTDVVEQLAKLSQDDIYGNLDTIRNFYATEHAKLINEQIGMLAVGTGTSNSVSGAGNLMFESIDRIVASYDEASGIGLSSSTTPTLGDVINPWGGAIDRSGGASKFDAYVKSASGTFGTAGALTDTLIREMIQGVKTNGANTNVVITGYDTYADLQGLYESSWRTANWGELMITTGLNGIETATGVDVGIRVATVYGLPLIQAVNTPADAKSRIYFLDTTDVEGYGQTRLGVNILRPTTFIETSERDMILLNALGYKGIYFTIGEHTCRFMGAQGKLRDLE